MHENLAAQQLRVWFRFHFRTPFQLNFYCPEDEGKIRRRTSALRCNAFNSFFFLAFCAFITVTIAIVVVTFAINYYCYCWQALQISPSRLPKWLANSLWQALNATATSALLLFVYNNFNFLAVPMGEKFSAHFIYAPFYVSALATTAAAMETEAAGLL